MIALRHVAMNSAECFCSVLHTLCFRPVVQNLEIKSHLYDQSSEYDGAEDGIVEHAFEDVPLTVNFAGIELVEDLHEDKSVEDDGVVLRWRGMEWGVPPAVNVKYLLTCDRKNQTPLSRWIYSTIPDSRECTKQRESNKSNRV